MYMYMYSMCGLERGLIWVYLLSVGVASLCACGYTSAIYLSEDQFEFQ